MNLVKQRYAFDCFLASMATLLQKDYDCLWPKEFQERIEANQGSYNGLAAEGYQILGFRQDIDYWQTPIIHKVYPDRFLRYFNGRPCLLQVPSLNDIGKSHLIVYHNGQIFDPSNKKTYHRCEDLDKVEWVTIFTHEALTRP